MYRSHSFQRWHSSATAKSKPISGPRAPNSAELGARGPDIGFDFAVAEECHRWNECDLYTDVYGDYVLDIEYFDDLRGTVEEICADANQPPLTVIRDRDLTTPDNPGYEYKVCV